MMLKVVFWSCVHSTHAVLDMIDWSCHGNKSPARWIAVICSWSFVVYSNNNDRSCYCYCCSLVQLRQKFDKLVKFSNPDRRCRSMRAHLDKWVTMVIGRSGDDHMTNQSHRQHPPGVPYTGGYLEHLWAIDNGQHTYTTDGLVNFAKMTSVSWMSINTRVPYTGKFSRQTLCFHGFL